MLASAAPNDRVPEHGRLTRAGRRQAKRREAVRLRTCQFFLPFHPSDGRGRLAADGRAGKLRLVALADHLVAALDEGASWRD